MKTIVSHIMIHCWQYKKAGVFNEKGNIAVIFGLSLSTLLLVMAFALNTGYLFTEKNRYQNAVDAAAMAGALRLCAADPEESAREIFFENLLANDPIFEFFEESDLYIQTGFYDVYDEYDDFAYFKNFVEKNQMPLDQYENAVMVRLSTSSEGIIPGFTENGDDGRTNITAWAVAYLKRYDMTALALNGDEASRIWLDGLKNGDIYVNGDLIYPEKPPMQFMDARLLAHGKIVECKSGTPPDWDNILRTSSIGKQDAPKIEEIPPCDDGYVNSLKPTADIVYEPEQAGTDSIFFGYCGDGAAYMSGGKDDIVIRDAYLFDIAEEPEERITYFFDASSDDKANVILTTGVYNQNACPGVSHFPRGDRISNITFIANCPILIFSPPNVGISLRVGDKGDRQFVVISSGDVIYHHSLSSAAFPTGISIRCGGDFYARGYDLSGQQTKPDARIRIVADGIFDYDSSSCGLYDFLFGPPCPPTLPKLGRLEIVSNAEK